MTGVVFAVLDRRAKSGIAYMAQTQEEKIVSRIQDVFRGLAANEARLLFAGSLQSVLVSKRHRLQGLSRKACQQEESLGPLFQRSCTRSQSNRSFPSISLTSL